MVGQGLLLRRGDAGVGEVVPCRRDTRGESLSVSGSGAQPALLHPTAGTEVIGENGWSTTTTVCLNQSSQKVCERSAWKTTLQWEF